MALINCPECGHQMSDTAKKCPNCGYSIRKMTKKLKEYALLIFGILIIVLSYILILVGCEWKEDLSIAIGFGILICGLYIDFKGCKKLKNDRQLGMGLFGGTIGLITYIFSFFVIWFWFIGFFWAISSLLWGIILYIIGLILLIIAYKQLSKSIMCVTYILYTLLILCTGILVYIVTDYWWKAEDVFDTYLSSNKKSEVISNISTTKQLSFDTKAEILSNIDGTIWTFTQPVDVFSNILLKSRWTRLEFKNGKVYIKTAHPSDGHWGDEEVKDYEVFEGRYSDTGEKYVAVKFGFYRFVPKTQVLTIPVEGSQIQLKQTDFNWD